MAYKINRTGDNVKALLDAVENKTIYPDASWNEHGLMSKADKIKLDNLVIHYNTTEYWNNARGFIPAPGAIVIYSDYQTKEVEGETVYIPGIKIGSGNGYVQDLAFIGDEDKDILLAHIADEVRHTSAAEKARWNNKLNVNDSAEVVEESLILNRQ
jgi:hypothetical protein